MKSVDSKVVDNLASRHGIADHGSGFAETISAPLPRKPRGREHDSASNPARAAITGGRFPIQSLLWRLYSVGPYKTTTDHPHGASSPSKKDRSIAVREPCRGINKLARWGAPSLKTDHGCGRAVTSAENGASHPRVILRGVGGCAGLELMSYSEKLQDPRWQRKRLEVLNRENFTCQSCGDKEHTLHVHHLAYKKNPWDVPLEDLECLCGWCHEQRTKWDKLIKRNRIPTRFLMILSTVLVDPSEDQITLFRNWKKFPAMAFAAARWQQLHGNKPTPP